MSLVCQLWCSRCGSFPHLTGPINSHLQIFDVKQTNIVEGVRQKSSYIVCKEIKIQSNNAKKDRVLQYEDNLLQKRLRSHKCRNNLKMVNKMKAANTLQSSQEFDAKEMFYITKGGRPLGTRCVTMLAQKHGQGYLFQQQAWVYVQGWQCEHNFKRQGICCIG